MNDPTFAVTNSDGTAGEPRKLSEWSRLLNETSAAVTMHAATRPAGSGDADAEAAPGMVRTLCMVQPASDHFRAAMKRDADAAAELSAKAPDLWKKWNGRESAR